MASTDSSKRSPVAAARTAAGRFRSVAGGRAPGRADELRRYRAAQQRLQSREQRFAHLKALHD